MRQVLNWPKSPFGFLFFFFCKTLWKNPNGLFGQLFYRRKHATVLDAFPESLIVRWSQINYSRPLDIIHNITQYHIDLDRSSQIMAFRIYFHGEVAKKVEYKDPKLTSSMGTPKLQPFIEQLPMRTLRLAEKISHN